MIRRMSLLVVDVAINLSWVVEITPLAPKDFLPHNYFPSQPVDSGTRGVTIRGARALLCMSSGVEANFTGRWGGARLGGARSQGMVRY